MGLCLYDLYTYNSFYLNQVDGALVQSGLMSYHLHSPPIVFMNPCWCVNFFPLINFHFASFSFNFFHFLIAVPYLFWYIGCKNIHWKFYLLPSFHFYYYYYYLVYQLLLCILCVHFVSFWAISLSTYWIQIYHGRNSIWCRQPLCSPIFTPTAFRGSTLCT